jgi:dephospho-CoA kinase
LKKPYLIGLTGGIGSGKSSVAAIFAQLGCEVVSGDELGKRVLEESGELIDKIRERYGEQVFLPEGKLNRKELGKLIFQSQEEVQWLTQLTFPGIYTFWKETILRTNCEVALFDAALIYEWKIDKEFDLMIAVVADYDIVLARALAKGKFSEKEIEMRLSGQLDYQEKIKRAHVVLVNNSTFANLQHSVNDLWKTIIEPELKNRR